MERKKDLEVDIAFFHTFHMHLKAQRKNFKSKVNKSLIKTYFLVKHSGRFWNGFNFCGAELNTDEVFWPDHYNSNADFIFLECYTTMAQGIYF